MSITTVRRTLTANDYAGYRGQNGGGHGGIVIPDNAQLEHDLQVFFGGVQIQQDFIDVRDQNQKYKLKYADYKQNGTTPNDRVTSINKYAKKHGLEVCDTLILEKIENGTETTYLIDYEKKISTLFFLGRRENKATVPNPEKFDQVIDDAKTRGLVNEPNPGVYHFSARMGNRNRQVVLTQDQQGLVEATLDGAPIGFTKRNSFEIDFTKSPIRITRAIQDWIIEVDKPILFPKYNSIPYDIQEHEDIIEDDDLANVTGNYSPIPADKKELKETGSGRKIYPRDKKVSANALKRANYTCEFCPNHPSFLRKNKNIKYMEPHHLIPLHMHSFFEKSLDVEANIVSLCSNCHNQIHYGDGRAIISRLWDLRQAELSAVQLDRMISGTLMSKDELLKMYGY